METPDGTTKKEELYKDCEIAWENKILMFKEAQLFRRKVNRYECTTWFPLKQ